MRTQRVRRVARSPVLILGAGLLLLATGVAQSLGATQSRGATAPPKFDPGKITGKVYGNSSVRYCKNPNASVKFGSDFELSGPIASFGVTAAQGVQLAVNEINSRGGFIVNGTCYKIDLTQQDNRSDAATAVAQIRGLVNDAGIRYIFGPVSGGLALLTAPIAQASDPPAINLSSGAALDASGFLGTEKYRGLFKTSMDQQTIADLLAGLIKKAYPKAKTAYLLFRNDTNGITGRDKVLASLAKVKIKVVGNDLFPPGTTDFSSFLGRVQPANPDIFYYGYNPTDDITITRQLVQLGLKMPLAVWQGQVSMALQDAIGRPIPNPFMALNNGIQMVQPTIPQTKAYLQRYKHYYTPTDQSYFSLWGYDYVYMLAKSMQLAKSTSDTDAVRARVLTMRWNGANGPMCWNKVQTAVTGLDSAFVVSGKTTWVHAPFDLSQCRPQ